MPYLHDPPTGCTDADEIKTPGMRGRGPNHKMYVHPVTGKFVMRTHVAGRGNGGARPHYWNQWEEQDTGEQPRYREVDVGIVSDGAGGWRTERWADWKGTFGATSDVPTTFLNLEPSGRGTNFSAYDEIGLKVASSVLGRYEVYDGFDSVIYDGALDTNNAQIDVRFISTNVGIRHQTEIRSRPNLPQQTHLELEYELVVPANCRVEIGGVEWDQNGKPRTSEVVRIGRQGTPRSEWIRLRRFTAWDQNGKTIRIEVDFEVVGNRLYMTKRIPKTFLTQAHNNGAYPVLTDAVYSPFSHAGDGSLETDGAQSTWSAAQSQADADGVTDTTAQRPAQSERAPQGGGRYHVFRLHIPFDLSSGVGAGATITGIDVKLTPNAINDALNDSVSYWCLVESQAADPTSIVVGDFDAIGDTVDDPTEMHDTGQRKDLTSQSAGTQMTFTYNSTGIATADPGGWLTVGVREGHDTTNTTVGGATAASGGPIRLSEYAATSSDPVADVTFSVPAGDVPKSRWHQYKQLLHH
jgi:hypothetical protein